VNFIVNSEKLKR